jgi:membrane dipeptidase
MIILDAHQDIAFNAVNFARDFRLPAHETRRIEAEAGISDGRGRAMFGLPDALLGRIAVAFGTIYVQPAANAMGFAPTGQVYRTPREAYAQGSAQADFYHRLADEEARIRLIRTQADLDAVLGAWEAPNAETTAPHGLMLVIENGDCITEPHQFEEWYARGVRAVGPAWGRSRYCGGTGEPGPLTDLGRELLDVMAGFNAILDLAHMAEAAYLEAVDRYAGEAIIASHANPRRFRNTDRHLSDDMIRRLAARDGVMGVVLFNRFLSESWVKGQPKSHVPLTVVLDVIDHVCQVTGSAAHVGIGSDFDGGFGSEETPEGLDTVADLGKIAVGLRARGYAEGDIEAIMAGNMLRKMRQALPAR